MPLRIVPFGAEHAPAVAAFNARLAAGGSSYRFPSDPVPAWLPRTPGSALYQELFLAVEGDTVRGGYMLKHQEFFLGGEVVPVANYQLPLSEGSVDRRYVAAGLLLLADALRRSPLLYALGIGGHGEPLARLLLVRGFALSAIPFYFRVLRPARFLRGCPYLRSHPIGSLACDLLAATGLGALGLGVAQKLGARPADARLEVMAHATDRFHAWADTAFDALRANLLFSAARDASTLARLYDAPGNRFIRLRLDAAGRTGGWAVLLATPLEGHRHFGNLRLGSIVDGLALPGFEQPLIRAATDRLTAEGVDLIVSNQSHQPLRRALRASGYLRGRSNFLFAASPELARRLGPLSTSLNRCHLNRGDGDGPVHL